MKDKVPDAFITNANNLNPFTKWDIPNGYYDYNNMKVMLIEGEGGNVEPYEDVLAIVGMTGRPEVEVIKLQQKTCAEIAD